MLSQSRSRSPARSLALRRALRRREEAGAALFVVAVTLALLAAMGVYGLNATALDVRSAGHNREAMTGQSVAQHAMLLTAESLSPSKVQPFINDSMYGANAAQNCRTAKKKAVAGGSSQFNNQEACALLKPRDLQRLSTATVSSTADCAAHPNVFGFGSGQGYQFQCDSFGKDNAGNPLLLVPNVQIEVTNPVAVSMPGFQGSDMNNNQKQFVALTVTVFTEMKEGTEPPKMAVVGRGRIVVGPASLPEYK
jgi:Tfp pilus assembly protein PilX